MKYIKHADNSISIAPAEYILSSGETEVNSPAYNGYLATLDLPDLSNNDESVELPDLFVMAKTIKQLQSEITKLKAHTPLPTLFGNPDGSTMEHQGSFIFENGDKWANYLFLLIEMGEFTPDMQDKGNRRWGILPVNYQDPIRFNFLESDNLFPHWGENFLQLNFYANSFVIDGKNKVYLSRILGFGGKFNG